MEDRHGVHRRDSVAWAAGVALTRLEAAVGNSGRAVLRYRPALLARLDQHAAEVRDTLADADGAIAVTALAGYADGVRDVAAARGIDADAPDAGDWEQPSWPLLRLLAVCVLAEDVQFPHANGA